MILRWWRYTFFVVLAGGLFAAALVALVVSLIYPQLPSLEILTDYQPKIPLRIYTADNALIGEFGEERRALIKIKDVPSAMRQAILAAEDDRFYQHGGVDYMGVARAAITNLTAGGAREGASTITMQVARNFFLSSEKTLTRKVSEVMLAMKIEHNLSKDQILELYINQIYLGQRAYGFAAASQLYFGKPLAKLSIAESAMLAGLPKAPSRYNPVVNPKRAKIRQQYVLKRMHNLHYIKDDEYQAALQQPLHIRHDLQVAEVRADHIAELVRQNLYERYHDKIYSSGIKVYTTLRRADQEAANQALRQGVLDYDRRHGYRGPEGYADLQKNGASMEEAVENALEYLDDVAGLSPAIVLDASIKRILAYNKDAEKIEISGEGLRFAQKYLAPNTDNKQRIRRGSIIRIKREGKENWQIAQLPQAEAALVSVDPQDGAIRAMAGGFDFTRNNFNHVTQAWRQPGSSFKPFVYSAALEKGFTPATIINDAPLSLPGGDGGEAWEPKNFDGSYSGPIRLRTALTKSKNLVSIRILQSITPEYAQDYITRFGFDAAQHPAYLTMALGAGSVTPLQMVAGYSVFANGGYRVKPYFIDRIVDPRGTVLAQSKPARAGESAERVIDARNAFIMTSLMQDVVRQGTATKAMQLGRHDLAGKTGTTNDQIDAWFCGFNSKLVAVAWIGFDRPRSLGGNETGGHAALPIWVSYMGKVLKSVPESNYPVPEGVSVIKINLQNGLITEDGGTPEFFYQEFPPPAQSMWSDESSTIMDGRNTDEIKDQLF
ncbi:MAG: penicillin-binding protein 1A [Gammaproteobacteria bacterium]|nr:penicillin-binding protein 1A [Gammaproteobacteria bacterium]MBU1731798.1 penicillin-binding protein 1A [Gammaproteobacteria bacterium]MBU1892622.1 penicillin-binding protein 1A [Gammaproteobacteria bacterium]